MAAPTDYFVDPSIAGDSGAGSLGDPYGDLQYALNQITRDATNGDRINIKAGTAELLTTSLSLATYGTPSLNAPLIFQGYASAAGDGDLDAGTGIGAIDMQGNNATIIARGAGISFIHTECFGTGSSAVLEIGIDQNVIECEIHESTGGGIIGNSQNRCSALGNHVHDTGGSGIESGSIVAWNYLKNDGTTDFVDAIKPGTVTIVEHNIISIDGATTGIAINNSFNIAWLHNSVLSSSGTGIGIKHSSGIGLSFSLANNLVEGFSGAGGIGIQLASGTRQNPIYAGNAVYNNTTEYNDGGKADYLLVSDNETLGASPFAKSGSDTFANRFTYFAPVDTGNVQGGAYPPGIRLDKGAVQHADPAGGGGTVNLLQGKLAG